MKEFLEYDKDNIVVTNDGTYIDFYNNDIVLENLSYETEDEATLGYLIHEPSLQELKEIKQLEEKNFDIEFTLSKNKEYLDEDFIYEDDKKKIILEKSKKEKKRKPIKKKEKKKHNLLKYFLNFIYFLVKILFLLFLYFLIFSVSRYYYLEDKYSEELSTEVVPIEDNSIVPSIPVSPELIVFKELMIEKCLDLNSIIEGEKDCINKLNENQISLYEASLYFDKTQTKKQTILDEFYDSNVSEKFFNIQNYLKEMYIYSINLSKQIKTRYNNSESNIMVINDFNDFLQKHNARISEYEILLENFK